MQWFQTTYTQRFNAKNQLWGYLFGDQSAMGHKTSVSRLSKRMKNELTTDKNLRKTWAAITRTSS